MLREIHMGFFCPLDYSILQISRCAGIGNVNCQPSPVPRNHQAHLPPCRIHKIHMSACKAGFLHLFSGWSNSCRRDGVSLVAGEMECHILHLFHHGRENNDKAFEMSGCFAAFTWTVRNVIAMRSIVFDSNLTFGTEKIEFILTKRVFLSYSLVKMYQEFNLG
jgi:hypothetical protein